MKLDLARLAALIQRDLDRHGWSQEIFAERVGLDQGKISKLVRRQMRRPSGPVVLALLEYFGPRLFTDSARPVPSSPDGSRQPMPNWIEDLVDMSTENDELREAWEKVHRLWLMSRKPRAGQSKENWTHLLKQARILIRDAQSIDEPLPKRRRDKAAGDPE